ncbi:MAG: hypothetical protein FJ044_01825 [Candidatus Cloacimonetes bacterium]|nr:hypothetical protein [Candidatus Cloacimonadota bacterium]
MQRYNNHHEFLPFFTFQIPGLSALFAAHTLRGFALSLIELFGPLYIFHLFKNHYHIHDINQLLILVLIYFALQKISILLLSYPISTAVARLGFRLSMLIGNILMAIKILFLIFAEKEILLLIPSALITGF